jgi:hypothetical protein
MAASYPDARVSGLMGSMTKPPEDEEQDSQAVPDVPVRSAVRTSLLIAGLGWLLVAAALYWQSWLELHLRPIVFFGVELAVLVVAFVPAISITASVSYDLWKRRRRRQVGLLAAVTVLVGAVIVVAPWQHGYMWTRFVLQRSSFEAVATLSCTPEETIDPYGRTVHRCQIALPALVRELSPNGPATFVRAGNGSSVLYWSAEPETPGGKDMFSLCSQEHWIHISGSIPAATWATDPNLSSLISDFPACCRSLGDGWWWEDACRR